ncbi:tetratricopeptide repeat protein [Amycolatopsis sp. NPDC058278]|uniref:tetratricopeptide repeat protein n=1 Tax=Amycolatopsis sp. NPDC058278 TaxID=3346417 RepID=UPI0036DBF7BC
MSESRGGNRVDGVVAGAVVQTRAVNGDIYLHQAAPSCEMVPRQIPPRADHFVGRSGELGALDGLLDTGDGGVHSCVVNGMPGVGKSALTFHWALLRSEHFPDGQLYVDLRGADPSASPMLPGEALRGFVDALGLSPDSWPGDLPRQSALFRSLTAGRRLLVVLDNASDSRQVEPLLPGGSACRVVVTSRRLLTNLVARFGARRVALEPLSWDEASDMLTRMVGAERTAAEPAAVARFIDYADRLPLAVAILGGRLAEERLSLSALSEQLCAHPSCLDGLETGEPGLGVRAVFSWSYRALTPTAAAVFRMTSLHPGADFTSRSAAALSGVDLAATCLALTELVRAHLVEKLSPDRYRMHDLLRRYARELTAVAAKAGEAALVGLADYYLHAACAANEHLGSPWDSLPLAPPRAPELAERFTSSGEALAWLDAERAGILATTSMQNGIPDSYVWRLATTLVTYLDRLGHRLDLLQSQRSALLAALSTGDGWAIAMTQRLLGRAHIRLGQFEEAVEQLRPALAYFENSGDRAGQAHTCYALSYIAVVRGHRDEGLELARRSLDLAEGCGRRVWLAKATGNLGWWHLEFGEPDQALALIRRALDQFRTLRTEPDGEAHTLECLGRVYAELELPDLALNSYAEALQNRRRHGSFFWQVRTHRLIADIQRVIGDRTAEREALEEALRILVRLSDPEADAIRDRLAELEAA